MRIFLDANVLFSASQPKSTFARLVALALERSEVVTSDLASEEARRNLVLKRPDWVETFDALIAELEVAPSVVFALPVTLAEKDVPILCAAIRAKCDLLVTGDRRDFGHLFEQDVRGVTVIPPLRLARLLAQT
ncbi:MAG: PIN domain-containing protein [Dehalococcoidia bacterium]